MKRIRLRVSDHALVRYLERVGGFDMEALRLDIARRLEPAVQAGASSVTVDGYTYPVVRDESGPVIATVLSPARRAWPGPRPAEVARMNRVPTIPLQGLAGEIEGAIGSDLALRLLRERGGTAIKVPVKAEGSTLAAIVGLAAAEAMIAHFGTGEIDLPLAHARGPGARRAKGIAMLRAGASLSAVALECETTERTASRWREEIDAEAQSRQMKLPF